MNPPADAPFRQGFAHRIFLAAKGFVRTFGLRHAARINHAPAMRDQMYRTCYPSPCLWPDRVLVGPFFWQSVADAAALQGIGFSLPAIVVNCASITAQTRGSSPCKNPFSCFPSLPSRWQVASRMTARARLSAQVSALRRPRSPTMTWPLGPRWVLAQVRCATTQAFANNLTGHWPVNKGHPGAGSGDLLHLRGVLCSPKS